MATTDRCRAEAWNGYLNDVFKGGNGTASRLVVFAGTTSSVMSNRSSRDHRLEIA